MDLKSTSCGPGIRGIIAGLLLVMFTAAACAGTSTVEAQGEPGVFVGCDVGASPIAELLGSGLPSYDYEPAADLGDLVGRSDLVVTGTLRSALRVDGLTDNSENEPVESQLTQLEAGDWEVLFPVDGDAALAEIFTLDSWWAGAEGDDPLGVENGFDTDSLRYVAFLNIYEGRPAPVVDVQGLVIACGDEPAIPVIEPLPDDATGLIIDELIARIFEITPNRGDNGDAAAGVSDSGRGESISLAHRVLADGLEDESREPWSTAWLNAAEVWAIDPDIELDEDSEVFFGFWMAESGSCPFAPMIDLRYDTEYQVIYPDVPLADGVGPDCDDDANAHLIMVAVPRSELPPGALTLWVDGNEPWEEGSTFIANGELTAPVGPDSGAAIAYETLTYDDELAVGETKIAIGVSTHCGLERLYWVIDGRQWLVVGDQGVPAEWQKEIRAEEIDLIITRTAEDQLEVITRATNAEGATYEPALDIDGCD